MLKIIRIIFPILLFHFYVEAQNPGAQKGFYGSVNIGPGIVNGNITRYDFRTSLQFAMHFNVGYFVNKSLQLGISGSGWLFEPYQSTRTEEKGESLSNTMIHAQYYPTHRCRLFIKGAYGISKYKNNRPLNDNGKGHAAMAAVGYEKHIGKNEILIGTQISYHYGKIHLGNLFTPNDQLNRRFQVVDLTFFIGLD